MFASRPYFLFINVVNFFLYKNGWFKDGLETCQQKLLKVNVYRDKMRLSTYPLLLSRNLQVVKFIALII